MMYFDRGELNKRITFISYSQNKPSTASSTAINKPSTAIGTTDNKAQTVYITKTGKKYHHEGCNSLSKSKISIILGDAEAKGYEPCSQYCK